jgi:hypothetical protein
VEVETLETTEKPKAISAAAQAQARLPVGAMLAIVVGLLLVLTALLSH